MLAILPHFIRIRQPVPYLFLSVPIVVVILKMLPIDSPHAHLFRAHYTLTAPNNHQSLWLLPFSLYVLSLTVLFNDDV
jgi:hypothetical protein